MMSERGEYEEMDCPACGETVKNLGNHIHGPNCNPGDGDE